MMDRNGRDWKIEAEESYLPPLPTGKRYYKVYANTTNTNEVNTFRVFSSFKSEEDAIAKVMEMIELLMD